MRGLAAIGIGRRTVLRDLKGLLTVDVAHLCVGLGVRRELSVRRRGGLGVGAMARKKVTKANLDPGIIQVVCAGWLMQLALA